MRTVRYLLLPILLCGLFCGVPRAAHAQDAPYHASVPVIDTSDVQRDHAISVALSMVLGEVASRDLTHQPGYADVLAKAPSYVLQYQYARAPAGAAAPFVLDVSFDAAAVRRLVAGMGVATWSGPQVPVVVQVQDAGGTPLDAGTLAPLVQAANLHGVQVVGADAGPLDATALAAGDAQALANVGRQYHSGLILLGKLDGAGSADWTLVVSGRTDRWHTRDADTGSMLADAGGQLVTHLMQRFASGAAGASEGTLWVSGVQSSNDFAQLLGMLRADDSVSAVDVREAQGDGVLLDISTTIPLLAVIDDLGAGGRVLPDATAQHGADASLRWLH
ncbi:MAG TPA: DUF2066 domain-containing protein [Rhodanobacteraceae bacterium]|jgi:hypothetical protein|nr:DUF2066 domain-containing protein [Rhodanobacteraceae bacterium]